MVASETFKPSSLRPVDLARTVGLSAQAVRNYEDDGILPTAERGGNGYRRYTVVHLAGLEAFVGLAKATSHSSARDVMRAINNDHLDDALEVIDSEHCQILKDRQTIRTIQSALADISSAVPKDRPALPHFTIGDLAHRVGVTSTTLRGWEQAGILAPKRQLHTGHRLYSQEDVQDAELAYLLRRSRRGLGDIALIVREVRTAGSTDALREAADDWKRRLDERARGLLDATAMLSSYLNIREQGR